MSLVVNLEEFSELCGVTAETMRGYLRGLEFEPAWLIERGDLRREYQIEAHGAVAWWKAKRAENERLAAEQIEAVSQLRLDILGEEAVGDELLTLSGKQRREEHLAALDRIKLRRTMAGLLEVDALTLLIDQSANELRQIMKGLCTEARQVLQLSDAASDHLCSLVEASAENWIAAATSILRPVRQGTLDGSPN